MITWINDYAHNAEPGRRIVQVRDCVDEGGGETYFAYAPEGASLSDMIEDYRETASYNGDCLCSASLFADADAAADDDAAERRQFVA